MPSPRAPRTIVILAPVVAAAALIAAGCGQSADEEEPAAAAAPVATEFPDPNGRTLAELTAESLPSDLVARPGSGVFHVGVNRLPVRLDTVSREPVNDAQLAIYAAPPGQEARGPFPATVHSLATDPAFRSETTADDDDAAEAIYASRVRLDREGPWDLLALIREGDGEALRWARLPTIDVGRFKDVPRESERAPVVHTPTVDDVGGDLSLIDTRRPPSTMHDHDLAEVLGEMPVVLLFATAALCESRVCGPVIDIAEQVKRDRADEAAWIHVEVFEDNQIDKGPNEQMRAFDLPTEPWLFVIDADGRISTAIEGAFGADELHEALDRLASRDGGGG